MRTDLYQELYKLEKDYWWHVGKRRIIFNLIKKFSPEKNAALDIGCGAGLVVDELSKHYATVYGLDNSEEALKFCRQRGLDNLLLSSAENTGCENESFDAITALDVLEHLDDVACLKECNKILRPGGTLFVNVPSYPQLWSYWDEMLGHKRRYTTKTLKKALEENGFKVVKITYSNFFILPLVIVARKLKSQDPDKRQQSDFIPTSAPLNSLLKLLYNLESAIINTIGFPAGLSVVAVAKKP